MNKQIIALVLGSTLLTACSAGTNNIEVVQTSEGTIVGAFHPPTDRTLIYYSEFELYIPETAVFESYGDQDNTRISWVTINTRDLKIFKDKNSIKTGSTDSVGRLIYTAPIKNRRFPNEDWTVDYIIGKGDLTAYMRIELSLTSSPNRDTQSKEFLADASIWVQSGSKIKVVE